jgi:hypothetical protein
LAARANTIGNVVKWSFQCKPLADGLLEEGESVTLTLQLGAGYALGLAISAIVTIADNRIAIWRQAHFGTTANSGNAANLANPDADAANTSSSLPPARIPTMEAILDPCC